MHQKNTFVGLLGILGIWLTAGLALPFVNVLKMFTPEQLMVFRGGITAVLALICLRGAVGHTDKYTYLMAITVPFATLGLFQGIRHWGVGPTIIVITATPLVNFVISLFLGRRLSWAVITGLVFLLVGVILARWDGYFDWEGLSWSVFGTIANGVFYEFLGRSKTTALKKCFWGSLSMATLGLIVSFGSSWKMAANPQLLAILIGFAFVGGFIYWLANLLAFEHLPTTEASVLAQGEAPAVVLGANLMLGERLTVIQWLGVIIALYGAWHLSRWLAQAEKS